jgi:23S rRNA (guanosine2251-2'-O)-methyltransferase
VLEALRAGRAIEKLIVQKNATGSIQKILDMARESHVSLQFADKRALDRIADGGGHQGVVAFVSAYRYASLDDVLLKAAQKKEAPLLLILDGVEDPHNLGAILRSAEGAGVHGVLIGKRRATGVTDAVARTSAGAAEHIPVVQVTNIVRTVETLQAAGLWTVALDMGGESYFHTTFAGPLALVVGGEGKGVSRLVRDSCDCAVSIPMHGKIASLNAAAATAVLIYEIKRQRTMEIGG